MTQGHARSDPIRAQKAQADSRERLAQQQPHRAGAVRPALPRDVPSSAVTGDTTQSFGDKQRLHQRGFYSSNINISRAGRAS
ncbi:hypothetical protein LTR87_015074 [Friedmanniomyces endolithicus]|nr:hypothetical protein LTR87_015074 [Friedmanniomyces endolithicus]